MTSTCGWRDSPKKTLFWREHFEQRWAPQFYGSPVACASQPAPRARINLLLNAALFVMMIVVLVSGLVISEYALPAAGVATHGTQRWKQLHNFTASLIIPVVALHLALNWSWRNSAKSGSVTSARPHRFLTNSLHCDEFRNVSATYARTPSFPELSCVFHHGLWHSS